MLRCYKTSFVGRLAFLDLHIQTESRSILADIRYRNQGRAQLTISFDATDDEISNFARLIVDNAETTKLAYLSFDLHALLKSLITIGIVGGRL
jgi:hypothetical protein